MEQGRNLTHQHRLTFDLGRLLTRGLRDVRPAEAELGRVLLDADDPERQQPERKAR